MAIITLTSDWGTSDYYAAAVKGVILSQLPNANIVEITHDIAPFNIVQAGFTLHNCYRNFPEGTIHIIAVEAIGCEPPCGSESPWPIFHLDGQWHLQPYP